MMTFPPHWTPALFLLNLAATLFMTGLICFVQVVHYPLFNQVGQSQFVTYHQQHSFWTGLVVGVPMLIEAISALALIWLRPVWFSSLSAWLGLVLVGVIWFSTAFLQVPQHHTLSQGFEQASYAFLVNSNWLRTLAWSLRSLMLLSCLWAIIHTR